MVTAHATQETTYLLFALDSETSLHYLDTENPSGGWQLLAGFFPLMHNDVNFVAFGTSKAIFIDATVSPPKRYRLDFGRNTKRLVEDGTVGGYLPREGIMYSGVGVSDQYLDITCP